LSRLKHHHPQCVTSDTIKNIAISIRQKYAVKTPDAIIAATAKSFDLPLVTADRDFKKIDGVDIVLLDLRR
jgi:predicted nucleic acid-binding protein